jgi:hypothetical protein
MVKRHVARVSAFGGAVRGAAPQRLGRLSAERVEQALDGLRFQQASFSTTSAQRTAMARAHARWARVLKQGTSRACSPWVSAVCGS